MVLPVLHRAHDAGARCPGGLAVILVTIKPGTEVPVGRAAGLIYAGVDELYPIVGRYSTRPESRRTTKQAAVCWLAMAHTLMALARRVSIPNDHVYDTPSLWPECSVICDATVNTPELIDQGRIAVMILIKPGRTVEYCGGTFILARVLRKVDGDSHERPCMEVEYRPLRM